MFLFKVLKEGWDFSLRIIAGSAKKMILSVPKGWTGRPTADRVKESLFNIVGNTLVDRRFLDIFSGTGNVGIEALSRGAAQCIFIEQNGAAVATIHKNLAKAGFENRAQVIKKDACRGIQYLSSAGEKVDFIFLDPPYDCGLGLAVLTTLAEINILLPGGFVVAESSKREEFPLHLQNLELWRREKYGDTLLWFYLCPDSKMIGKA